MRKLSIREVIKLGKATQLISGKSRNSNPGSLELDSGVGAELSCFL